MTEFIDTHTHMYDEAFAGEEDKAIERAVSAGVTRLVFPDIDSTSREAMFTLADRHPGTVFPCLGLHPTSVDKDWETEYGKMMQYSGKTVYAIGEIGMDCYWSKEFVREQEEAFRTQLQLACSKGLPVIIHSRNSTDLILRILDEYRHMGLRGVFHAFSGSIETFRALQKYGDWYVGIGGVLTYRNASIAETVRDIPTDRILLETDSPYLTPVPKRGSRNESSYIPYIAEKLAMLKGLTSEETAAATTANARALFGI